MRQRLIENMQFRIIDKRGFNWTRMASDRSGVMVVQDQNGPTASRANCLGQRQATADVAKPPLRTAAGRQRDGDLHLVYTDAWGCAVARASRRLAMTRRWSSSPNPG